MVVEVVVDGVPEYKRRKTSDTGAFVAAADDAKAFASIEKSFIDYVLSDPTITCTVLHKAQKFFRQTSLSNT